MGPLLLLWAMKGLRVKKVENHWSFLGHGKENGERVWLPYLSSLLTSHGIVGGRGLVYKHCLPASLWGGCPSIYSTLKQSLEKQGGLQ